MKWIKFALNALSGNIVKDVGDALDKNITSRDEIEKRVNHRIATTEQEITERLRLDTNSDSFLSKNIRPLTLLIGWLVFVSFSFLDGNWVEIKQVYVELRGKMMWTLTGFYFGLREVGKQLIKRKQ